MALALIAVFARQAGQVQVGRRERQTEFLLGLAAGAGVGRFACIRVEFPAARAPQAQVRLLRPFEKQHLIALVEAIQQGRQLVRQFHARGA